VRQNNAQRKKPLPSKKAEEDKAADDVRRQLFAVGVNPDKTSMEKILDAAMEPANVLADIANGTKKISDLAAGLKAAYNGQADVMVDLLMSHTAEIKDLKKRLEATHTHT
jgi:hypothetical protein